MKRYLLILLILSSLTYSCNVKKKITTQTTVDTEIQNETIKRETQTNIRTPKSNIFLSDRIVSTSTGGIQRISRTIVDPVTKQTLKLDISESGEVSVASITPADTISVSQTDMVDKTNSKSSTDINTDEEVKVKFNLSSILTAIIGGFIGLVPGGGIIGYIILFFILIAVILFVKRLFKSKNSNEK